MPQISAAEYGALPLRVHTLLADVPLHDVWAVDLPRAYVRALRSTNFIVYCVSTDSSEDFRRRSIVRKRADRRGSSQSSLAPGTPDGPFRVVYRFENELLLEMHNRTVHGALLMALAETEAGYRFYLAVYVCKAGWITPVYMALIDPFRRWIVYPAMLKNIRAIWAESA